MVVFLVAVIVVLIGVIIHLNLEFWKEKKRFRIKIDAMQQVIADITRKQSGQNNRVKLSDELNATLKSSQQILSQDIFGLNYELFDMLKNNRAKE